MPFRVALDVRRIRDFGIGTYIRNLVRNLSRLDQENHYVLVATESAGDEFAGLGANFEVARFTARRYAPLNRLTFPLFLRQLGADVFHLPLNAVPFAMPRPYIVTIHDMSSLFYDSGKSRGRKMARMRRGLSRAERVIAVSSATRRDVEDVFKIPADRIRVIPNAPDPAFYEPVIPAIACIGPDREIRYPEEMKRILDRYRIDFPFLLYAGTIRPQKNIPRMVEAFSMVRAELERHPVYNGLRLIIIGDEISTSPSVRRAVIQSRVENSVRFLGFVPIDTLRVFYQSASVFVFPSLYEGFGLPPLEAMACGTPVVCSHFSSLPEVVGDAVVVVNPENVFDIARGMREALLDQGLRSQLVQRGLEQSRRFDWQRTAAQVQATYSDVARGRLRG
ncbi:MAG TPA: glycosyltransferase family 1 protein [Bryobacteraceae bacterium]|nr:glycosyltransferase family 1 protein [Bryobacteraceae bacterium]